MIPARRGFALRDKLASTKAGYSCGGLAVEQANKDGYDRIIVLTDGQWHKMTAGARQPYEQGDAINMCPAPLCERAYMVNLAPHAYGYTTDKWHVISGWSERILDFIAFLEGETEVAKGLTAD